MLSEPPLLVAIPELFSVGESPNGTRDKLFNFTGYSSEIMLKI